MQKFNPFDRVLVRQSANHSWSADMYDRFIEMFDQHVVISGASVEDTNILPFNEETKYLHNTVGEFTKWEPEKGEPILVKDINDDHWTIRIFLGMDNGQYICTIWHTTGYSNTVSWDQAKPYINPFKR